MYVWYAMVKMLHRCTGSTAEEPSTSGVKGLGGMR